MDEYRDPTHDSLLARLARDVHPHSGWCLRCGVPWAMVRPHDTQYQETDEGGRGMFCLCKECWTLLGSPEARIEYYKAQIDWWDSQSPVDEETKRLIQMAVANGG